MDSEPSGSLDLHKLLDLRRIESQLCDDEPPEPADPEKIRLLHAGQLDAGEDAAIRYLIVTYREWWNADWVFRRERRRVRPDARQNEGDAR
jgi:hypothetical protein